MRPRTLVSFTITILAAFAIVFALGVAAVVLAFRDTGAAAALQTAERSIAQAGGMVAARTRALLRPVMVATGVLPHFAPLERELDAGGRDAAALLALVAEEAAVQVVSVGLASGVLRQVLRFDTLPAGIVPPDRVPAGTAYLLRESLPDPAAGRRERWIALDGALRSLGEHGRAAPPEDPRASIWYRQAAGSQALHVSPLYDLGLIGRPGLSVSRALPDGAGVLALDITLEALSAFLARQSLSPNATLFLFDEDGILLAHQDPARAMLTSGEGATRRSTWVALPSIADPLLAAVWRAYASGALRPGETQRLSDGGVELLARIEPVDQLIGPQLYAAVVAPVADFTGPVLQGVQRGTLRAALALVAGLGGIGLVAWRISRPLGLLAREAEAIRHFELDRPIALKSRITEVARLAEQMAHMKAALRTFGAYVPRDLVRRLVGGAGEARLGGDRRPLTVLFTDVEGFTAIAETMGPEELMRLVSRYLEAMCGELLAGGATIDKYIGDGIMAFWNAPNRDARHAAHACRAALAADRASRALALRFAEEGLPPLRTRFGLHSGEAIVGNIGSSDRMSYTAMGSMVNLASRLEGLNKFYGTTLLVSGATRDAAGPGFALRAVDLVLPKGAQTPIEVFELLGTTSGVRHDPLALPAERQACLDHWAAMIACYRAGNLDGARAALAQHGVPPGDRLAATYAERLDRPGSALAPDWSPVIRFAEK
jgi:adenylate cyclase